jgi:hypothetical protein
MIDIAIKKTEGVKIIVVDGVVDVMEDFMDAKEGHAVITFLIKICSKYNVHVAGVLHQNKADKNARAHVGTISSQKCEVEIACEVEKGITKVECRASRGLPFEPFAVKWDRGQLPCIVQEYKPGEEVTVNKIFTVDSLSFEQHSALVQEIFKGDLEYNNGDLKDRIKASSLKKKMEIIPDPLARQLIIDWEKSELIKPRKGARNAKIFRQVSDEI